MGKSTDIIEATSSFAFKNASGLKVNVRKGETFHPDSPRLAGLSKEAFAGSFKPFAPDHDVETATARPGEKSTAKRKTTGGGKKAAKTGGGDGEKGESSSQDGSKG